MTTSVCDAGYEENAMAMLERNMLFCRAVY